MLFYRNTKTGAVITVLVPVGGDWELVEEKKEQGAETEPAPKPKKKKTVKKG